MPYIVLQKPNKSMDVKKRSLKNHKSNCTSLESCPSVTTNAATVVSSYNSALLPTISSKSFKHPSEPLKKRQKKIVTEVHVKTYSKIS